MIIYDDVLSAYPKAADLDMEAVEAVIANANIGLPDARFKGRPGAADQGRILYVIHMLEKPGTDINHPAVLAQMGMPKPFGKKPHPWSSTEAGQKLMASVKY